MSKKLTNASLFIYNCHFNCQVYCLRWKLFFNENKFVHIRFCSTISNNTTTYKVNDMAIDFELHHKDLGVLYSHNLTWTEHYKHITAKAYDTLGLLRRTFKTNNIQAKKHLYISLVRSQLLYCSQLWRPQLIRDIQNLERILFAHAALIDIATYLQLYICREKILCIYICT